jgi:hypothetical protein
MYVIDYYRGDGSKLFSIPNFTYLRYTRVANQIGSLTLKYITEPQELFYNDYLIVYRNGKNDSRTIWFVNKISYNIIEREYTLECVCANSILNTRIIAYHSGSPEARKTDYPDNMIYEIIDENFLNPTDENREVHFETGLGNSTGEEITRSFARKAVLTTIQEICDAASIDTRLYFDMTYTDRLSFRVFQNYIGIDTKLTVSAETGVQEIVVSDDFSNICSFIYVGGQDTGVNRAVGSEQNVLKLHSPFKRIEQFYNASQYEDITSLKTIGRSILFEKRPKKNIEVLLTDNPSAKYNIDWSFGDRVYVEVLDKIYTANIDAVQVHITHTGEHIKAYLSINADIDLFSGCVNTIIDSLGVFLVDIELNCIEAL